VHRIGRTGRAGNGGIAISFCSKMNIPTGKTFKKLIKVDVKTSDHQYHWHSGSPELPAGSAKKFKPKEEHTNQENRFLNKKKNVGIDLVYILTKRLCFDKRRFIFNFFYCLFNAT
jgi:ATP-dependent RNA helicase RhlE